MRQDGPVGGGRGGVTVDAGPAPTAKRRRHPHALPDGLHAKVLALSREYSEWGCDRISHYLKLQGSRISPTTIQKILTRNGLRTLEERGRVRVQDSPT